MNLETKLDFALALACVQVAKDPLTKPNAVRASLVRAKYLLGDLLYQDKGDLTPIETLLAEEVYFLIIEALSIHQKLTEEASL
jgi:hypothetical protein